MSNDLDMQRQRNEVVWHGHIAIPTGQGREAARQQLRDALQQIGDRLWQGLERFDPSVTAGGSKR